MKTADNNETNGWHQCEDKFFISSVSTTKNDYIIVSFVGTSVVDCKTHLTQRNSFKTMWNVFFLS